MIIIYVINFDLNKSSKTLNVISADKASAMKAILGENNFQVWHPNLSSNVALKYFQYITFDLKCALKILFLNNKQSYRIIYRNLFFPLSNIAMKMKKIKSAHEIHADFENEIAFLNKSPLEMYLLKCLAFFVKFNLRSCNAFIFNHPSLKNHFGLKYSKPSIYTYNGVNIAKFNTASIEDTRKKIGLPKERTIALFIGSISKWHGVDYLINIFNSISFNENPNLYLYIVGATKNEYIDSLKETASKNNHIIFINRVPKSEANDYINAANVCLMPVNNNRISPGSPLKLYEYAACGKPIITQENLYGYSDEVLNNQLGMVTDLTNPQKASKDIINFIRTADWELYTKNNRSKSIMLFDWKHRVKHWIDLVKSL
jgi:glycosyltransferase involved in cell wall biosynthesis